MCSIFSRNITGHITLKLFVFYIVIRIYDNDFSHLLKTFSLCNQNTAKNDLSDFSLTLVNIKQHKK